MALPASGQLNVSDLRTEMDLSSVSNFSFSYAATGNYVKLNSQSPSLPTANPFNNFNLTQWYSYCHKCASSCGPSIYDTSANEYAVIDLETTSGRVSYSGFSSDTWALYLGYPYNSSGTLVGTSIASGGYGNFSSTYDYTYSTERNLYFFATDKGGRIQVSCPEVNLYWSFSLGANSGTFVIDVNGSQVVNETSTSSGNITVAFGDSVTVDVSSTVDFLTADATTSIVEDSTQVCSDNQTGFPTAYSNCTRTVAGFDLEVYGTAAQV